MSPDLLVDEAQAASGIVAVATSGGRDSMALLHATLRASAALGLRVMALHVHHGLMAEADGWARQLETLCARWSADGQPVAFACTRLTGAPSPGESVEAWARRGRYAALARMARDAGASLVLLGHHRRDQAETVLLQALRGAGPAGLAAMPRLVERDGIVWARPWLTQASDAIDAYAGFAGLEFVQDPSNADPRFARSRLRRDVMPALRDAFPAVETALAAVGRHAHDARSVLDEVAAEDLRRIGADAALPLAPWRTLSPARRANALRAWLAARAGIAAPDALLRRVLDETADDATRRWPIDAARRLRSWRGHLALVGAALVPAPAPNPGQVVARAAGLSLPRCDRYAVDGWAGHLDVFPVESRGIEPARLAQVLVRGRVGGERFRLLPGGTARSLKKQYQAAGIPEEGRTGPLIFDEGGVLLFVPGLGIDAGAWAPGAAPQWGMRWHAGPQGEG